MNLYSLSFLSRISHRNMEADEEIVNAFINGVAYITGNTAFSEKLRKQLMIFGHKIWLAGLFFWVSLIAIWFWQ